MPKLSVIVPVYNTEKYLRECIESILSQTFTDFELILVNDGSTDKSGVICDEYAQVDDRVHVIHQGNEGVTYARKRGVEIAVGEYITFVDSDDWIDVDMYRIMLAQESADVVVCNMFQYTKKGIFELKSYIKAGSYDKQRLIEKIYPIMIFDYDSCSPAIMPSLCNKLIHRKIINKIISSVDDRVTYGEDALCSYSCILEADTIYVVNQALYYYRENPSSEFFMYNDKMFSELILLGTEMERIFVPKDFNALHQIYGYLARVSLEGIRSLLLFHITINNHEKRKETLKYLKNPLISVSFRHAILHIKDCKTRFKMLLVINRQIGLLNAFYEVRRMMTRRKIYEN